MTAPTPKKSISRRLQTEHQKGLTDALGSFIAEVCDLVLSLLQEPASAKLCEPTVERARRYLATRGAITGDPYWVTKMRAMVAADDTRKERLRANKDPFSI